MLGGAGGYAVIGKRTRDRAKSESGQSRRPLRSTATCRFPLWPVSDRGRMAAQYVAKGQ